MLIKAAGKPLTLAEITKKAGEPKAVGNHLRTLVGKGFVKHTDNGYLMVVKAKK